MPICSFVIDLNKTFDDLTTPPTERLGLCISGSVFHNREETEDPDTHEVTLSQQYTINLNAPDLVKQAAAAFGVAEEDITVSGQLHRDLMQILIGASGPAPK